MTDQEIITAVKSGQKEAYRLIIEKYKSMVIGTIYNMIGFLPESEDIAQDVFIRFYNNIDNFRGDASLKTYLTRIAINLSLNELKRRKKRYFESIEDNQTLEHKESHMKLDSIETKDLIQKALLNLDHGYRSVINLRLIQEFSTRETAAILDIPEGTVLSRLSRAQDKLKTEVARLMEEYHG